MSNFIEFCVDACIQEANKYGYKPRMLETFRQESDTELVQRILSIMDELEMAFVCTGKPLFVCSRTENAVEIVKELKKRLASEIEPVVAPPI